MNSRTRGKKGENSGICQGTAPIASVRKKGGGGVDRDVRFNSQQRGTGGGEEIKISRNKRT